MPELFIPGVIGLTGDDYNPATSTGFAKYLADAIAAVVPNFKPGAAGAKGKLGLEAFAQGIFDIVDDHASGGASAPDDATYITQTPHADLSAEQALSLLATGILKSTTGTGVVSIAAEGADYYKPGGTDVAVADGGTGASTAAGARANLGLGTMAEGSFPVTIAQGGTGQTTKDEAFDALSPTTTNGDLIVYDSGDNVRLPVGSDGEVLTLVSGMPSWEPASDPTDGWQFIEEVEATNDAVIELDFDDGYDDYRVEIFDMLPVTDSEFLQAKLSQSGAFLGGANDYIWHTAGESSASIQTRTALAGGPEIFITPNSTSWQVGNVAGEGVHFLVAEISDVLQSTRKKLLEGFAVFVFDVGTVGRTRFSAYIRANNDPVDGIRFYMSAGNISSGKFRLFGKNR